MIPVIRYTRDLRVSLNPNDVEGVSIRHYEGSGDIARWLDLRERAFAAESPPVGRWTERDFRREFLAKRWWRPDRMWLAESVDGEIVGTVTMGIRGTGETKTPTIHWLMVAPPHRHRGIGRLLIASLEAQALHEGFREVGLETHVGWTSAKELYESLGYARST